MRLERTHNEWFFTVNAKITVEIKRFRCYEAKLLITEVRSSQRLQQLGMYCYTLLAL